MTQYQEPISSMETEWIPLKPEPEEAPKQEEGKVESSNHSSSMVLSRLHAMGDELCAKLQKKGTAADHDDNPNPSDILSWSSYQPTLGNTITTNEDQSSATTWLRARKDRYVNLNDTPVSTIGSYSSSAEKQRQQLAGDVMDEVAKLIEEKTAEREVAESRDDDKPTPEVNQTAKDIISKLEIDPLLVAKSTEDQFMDHRLMVSFREDETSEEEAAAGDSQKKSNGALDKY
ncbi:MAG: hypothetical protein SGARI_008027, partial [Bacillariaceae sp.]